MKPKTHCPNCGHTKFQVVCRMLVDVTYDEDGDHTTGDGPYGDIEFGDDSCATCSDCGWSGALGDLVRSAPSDAAKAAAVLCFTSGGATARDAVKLYNELSECKDDETILEVLENNECLRWEAVEVLSPLGWLANIVMLARSIDECREELV